MSFNALNKLLPYLIRLFFFLEPLSPIFLKRFVNRRIKRWRQQGIFGDYKLEMERVGRFHYRMRLNVLLESAHLQRILQQALLREHRIKKIFRR